MVKALRQSYKLSECPSSKDKFNDPEGGISLLSNKADGCGITKARED